MSLRSPEGPSPAPPARRGLLVDDNELLRSELASLMAEEGHSVRSAASVDEALGFPDREPFDVRVCDDRMPRRSGAELLEIAAKRWPALQLTSLTGPPSNDDARRMMERGRSTS